jgi:quinol monooxygenase YgiN
MTVSVVATLYAVEGKRDELLALVVQNVPNVLAEDGCLQYAPHTVGKDRILMIESWASLDALGVHGETPGMAAFQASIKDLVSAPTEIVVARPVDVP